MTPSNRNRMLTKELLEAYRNVPLCDVHIDAWHQIIDTALALYAVKEAAENSCCENPCYGNCRVSIDEALDALREGER